MSEITTYGAETDYSGLLGIYDIFKQMALICIPIRAQTVPELKKIIKKTEKNADIIELWVDSLANGQKPAELMKLIRKPVIIVNKGKEEKGRFRGGESTRVKILSSYLKAGAAFVDVALETDPHLLKDLLKSRRKNSKVILSYHDFRSTPSLETLRKIRDRGFRLGADIVKIATTCNKMEDNLVILNLLMDSAKSQKPCIALCMGEKGRISRLLASACGSYIIYLAPDGKNRTAPGQLTLDEYSRISSLLKL